MFLLCLQPERLLLQLRYAYMNCMFSLLQQALLVPSTCTKYYSPVVNMHLQQR